MRKTKFALCRPFLSRIYKVASSGREHTKFEFGQIPLEEDYLIFNLKRQINRSNKIVANIYSFRNEYRKDYYSGKPNINIIRNQTVIKTKLITEGN